MKHWKWFGNAAHFICGSDCRFHLATQVGRYMVSTVGELWPDRQVREIHARVYDPKWLEGHKYLKGDAFDAAYMQRFGYQTIGCDRKYETMVFKILDGECSCGCGLPKCDFSNVDFLGYNDPKEATAGHMELCKKWSRKKK